MQLSRVSNLLVGKFVIVVVANLPSLIVVLQGQQAIGCIEEANAAENTDCPHVEIQHWNNPEKGQNLCQCRERKDVKSAIQEDLVCELPEVCVVVFNATVAVDVVVVGAAEAEELEAEFGRVHDRDAQEDDLYVPLPSFDVLVKLFT